MNNDINVILASASPRRKELLKMLYADFSVCPADIDEENLPEINAYDVAEYLAVKKAKAMKISNSLIIACDTVVIINDKILGKPKDSDDALKMLSELSGKRHDVVTGVCIFYKGKSYSFSEKTAVEFFTLSEGEISAYVMTGEPLDKAGAYGIQGLGGLLVKGIVGDFYNVVGLPVSRLKREISNFFSLYNF